MGTRNTIRREYDEETGQGYHLFTDWLDQRSGKEVVHLRLQGVAFEAFCDAGGAWVTITMGRDLATRIGVLATPSEQPLGAGAP